MDKVIPPEILTYILEFLTAREMASVMGVCRDFRNIIQDSLKFRAESLILKEPQFLGFPNNVELRKVLRWACSEGHVEVVHFLKTYHHIRKIDAVSNDDDALRRACTNGHLDIVRYFRKEFKYTMTDLRSSSNIPLNLACEHGHLDIVRYFVRGFRATRKDFINRKCMKCPLVQAYKGGHLNVIQYLENHFKGHKISLRKVLNTILAYKQHYLFSHLKARYGLDSLIKESVGAFVSFCMYGDVSIIQFFVEEIGLQKSHIPNVARQLGFWSAYRHGYIGILRYLRHGLNFEQSDIVDENGQPSYYAIAFRINNDEEIVNFLRNEFQIVIRQ